MRKAVVWLLVSETLVLDQLVPMLWGLGLGGTVPRGLKQVAEQGCLCDVASSDLTSFYQTHFIKCPFSPNTIPLPPDTVTGWDHAFNPFGDIQDPSHNNCIF